MYTIKYQIRLFLLGQDWYLSKQVDERRIIVYKATPNERYDKYSVLRLQEPIHYDGIELQSPFDWDGEFGAALDDIARFTLNEDEIHRIMPKLMFRKVITQLIPRAVEVVKSRIRNVEGRNRLETVKYDTDNHIYTQRLWLYEPKLKYPVYQVRGVDPCGHCLDCLLEQGACTSDIN